MAFADRLVGRSRVPAQALSTGQPTTSEIAGSADWRASVQQVSENLSQRAPSFARCEPGEGSFALSGKRSYPSPGRPSLHSDRPPSPARGEGKRVCGSGKPYEREHARVKNFPRPNRSCQNRVLNRGRYRVLSIQALGSSGRVSILRLGRCSRHVIRKRLGNGWRLNVRKTQNRILYARRFSSINNGRYFRTSCGSPFPSISARQTASRHLYPG